MQSNKKKDTEKKPTASGIVVHCSHSKLEDITALVPNPRNPNKHGDKQVALLAKIIRNQGWRNPIVVSRRSGFIVKGHGRLDAARLLQVEVVPVDVQDYESEASEWADMIADNRIAELAEADEGELAKLISELEGKIDIELTGFDADSLPEIEPEQSDVDAEPQVDKAEELRVKWDVQPGQIWKLGEHRLMCGDSTKKDDVDRVMDGEKINLAFTSPPYASQRTYDESSGFKPIPPDQFVEWFKPIAANVKSNLASDGSWFVNIKPACEGLSRLLYVFDLVLAHVRNWGWNFSEEFCWERTGIPQQVARRFKNQFEPVYHFTLGEWKFRPRAVMHESDAVPIARGKGAGDTNTAKRQGVVSAVDGNDVSEGMAYPGNRLPKFQSEALGHSAAFPVGLPSFFIKAYTDHADTVYEPFSGSGTTIIACERLGRKCRAMEISPAYVAVAIQRWVDATGGTPELVK